MKTEAPKCLTAAEYPVQVGENWPNRITEAAPHLPLAKRNNQSRLSGRLSRPATTHSRHWGDAPQARSCSQLVPKGAIVGSCLATAAPSGRKSLYDLGSVTTRRIWCGCNKTKGFIFPIVASSYLVILRAS